MIILSYIILSYFYINERVISVVSVVLFRVIIALLIIFFIINSIYTTKIANIVRPMLWLEEVDKESFTVWVYRVISIAIVTLLVIILYRNFLTA